MRALFFSLMMVSNNPILFDFSKESSLSNWFIINDGVMGGLSEGALELTSEGHGSFTGQVRLENYGGFTSIRCATGKIKTPEGAIVRMRVKGDGKNYQFRVKHKARDYQSYITTFSTSGEWETIEIPLSKLYPSFRGRVLDMPNFNHSNLTEFTFLIANKKAETFELLIDSVKLVQ
jgi:NADH dehydrogenase [ubiquinone] 1 alpha subcomplex assembly factor 1